MVSADKRGMRRTDDFHRLNAVQWTVQLACWTRYMHTNIGSDCGVRAAARAKLIVYLIVSSAAFMASNQSRWPFARSVGQMESVGGPQSLARLARMTRRRSQGGRRAPQEGAAWVVVTSQAEPRRCADAGSRSKRVRNKTAPRFNAVISLLIKRIGCSFTLYGL